jgi:ABC-type transport system involved in multi-copper enzyme maturation permease subunit
VKIWTIALNTLSNFLRDKLIILFTVLFACVVLFMMTPMLALKAVKATAAAAEAQGTIVELMTAIMTMVSGCGSLLAAWAAAHSVLTEMKSGTILAVMARPVKRWEFLAGKYLGTMLLMTIYVLMMFGLSYVLAWMGGERIHTAPWVLLAYPLVRYAIYAALATLLVTVLNPAVTFGIVAALSVLTAIVAPGTQSAKIFAAWVRRPFYVVLPSTKLLSEERFLAITQASLKHTPWLDHVTTLAYGMDYALVCLLLAMWSFHYRSLRRD